MRVVVGILIAVAVLVGGAAIWVTVMDRQMESAPLVDRLDGTPVPDGFVLVDESNRDGDWLIKPRDPEARRVYVADGTVDAVCERIDRFHADNGVEAGTLSRSDSPEDWCGRSLRLDRGDVRVWVEPIRSWTDVPAELSGIRDLVEVTYFATRG